MKILLISGFLGSGKTTFISELVKKTDASIAIMENEYGALDIDGGILSRDNKVYDFYDGCICCSMKSDSTSSVLAISNSVDVEHLIIEPTGLGLLGNILESLGKIAYERIELLGPVTIVDGINFLKGISEYDELMSNQIKYAQTIVLSKIENMSKTDISILKDSIQAINPHCFITDNHYSTYPQKWWDDLFEKPLCLKGEIENLDVPDFDTIAFKDITFSNSEELTTVISNITRERFGEVTRAKGYFIVDSEVFKIDIVEDDINLDILEDMEDSKFVIIGRNLDREGLKILFDYYSK